jgi:4a-hydroxytetrahydrobiopterin dehydratase
MNQTTQVSGLADKHCVACHSGEAPLKGTKLHELLEELDRDWRVVNAHHLEKDFEFHNFRDALAFTNKIGELAEAENHHPDIYLSYGKVRLTLWTHKIDGLSESDFVFAAKADQLFL